MRYQVHSLHLNLGNGMGRGRSENSVPCVPATSTRRTREACSPASWTAHGRTLSGLPRYRPGMAGAREGFSRLGEFALNRLRAGQPLDNTDFYSARGHRNLEHEFDRLFNSLIRMELAGPSLEQKEGYAAHVNGLVQFLDLMSERHVIPGRGFTPTTYHSLHDLRPMFVCLLLAASDTTREFLDSAKISASIDRIEEYFSDEGLSALKPYLD